MRLSYLGLDYLLRFPAFDEPKQFAVRGSVDDTKNLPDYGFYINEDIQKSSVGDHYTSQMKILIRAQKQLVTSFRSFFDRVAGSSFSSDAVVTQCVQKFFPLAYGTVIPDNGIFGELVQGIPRNMIWGQQGCFLDAYGHVLFTNVNKETGGYYKKFVAEQLSGLEPETSFFDRQCDILERIGVSLCTGFTPKDTAMVSRLSNNMDQYYETLLAAILYPWVTQPMPQLRLLVSTLPTELKKNIYDAYFGEDTEAHIIPGNAESFVGNTFTFEILADYRTYLEFMLQRSALTPDSMIHVMRQAWTPWFGFDMPSVLNGVDDETMSLMDDLYKKSAKLFTDILHTGLKWDAQYAVMVGYRGRFVVSGPLSGFRKIISDLKSDADASMLTKKVAETLEAEILKIIA